jgi:DNA polymerase elongation subunit (family B)
MVTDVREEENGVFHLWGVTASGDSVLARIPDFEPYFYVTAPEQSCEEHEDDTSALVGTLNRCAAEVTRPSRRRTFGMSAVVRGSTSEVDGVSWSTLLAIADTRWKKALRTRSEVANSLR